MNQKLFLLSAAIVFSIASYSQEFYKGIIPRPVSVHPETGKNVFINHSSAICCDSRFSAQADYLSELIKKQCGFSMQVTAKSLKKRAVIFLNYDSVKVARPEMYLLTIRNGKIDITARDVPGIVHGIQTLIQLMPLEPLKSFALSPVSVLDYPRFSYRGMHLDVSRHFFPVDYIKKYIDYMAFHKFNTFHWHLTDDQGWRIEIKHYPKLTEVGAWRDSTLIGHAKILPYKYDHVRYGGFYTQEQIRDIVHYAAVRGINIIPEVDIPGHSRSIIASYPELSTRPDTSWQVSPKWGMFNKENNVIAPNDKTFEFLETVFGEIADLFPSPYIHLGGDECSKMWWKADAKTQAFIRAKGLADEVSLQTYIVNQVMKDLQRKGKKVIGWDEILEGAPDTSVLIMNWRGIKPAIEAVKRNMNVIVATNKPLYFNYYQSKDPADSLAQGGYNPLDMVYDYDPVPQEIRQAGLSSRILGAQGNVWTEYMTNPSKIEYMIFPRMTALSEALWSSQKDYADFLRRLKENAIPRYHLWKCSYFKDYQNWTANK